MPYRGIVITREASKALNEFYQVEIPPKTYFSEKGDIGAVIARILKEKGIDEPNIGLGVAIARENGCYTFEPEEFLEEVQKEGRAPQREEPTKMVQLGFDFLRNPFLYDETAHLTPEGERKN